MLNILLAIIINCLYQLNFILYFRMSDLLSAALSESGLDEFLREETSTPTISSSLVSGSDSYINGIDYYENEEVIFNFKIYLVY